MSELRFVEHQALGRWWLWVLVALAAASAWWGFVAQVLLDTAWSTEPVPDWSLAVAVLVVGIGLPVILATARLAVTVDDEALVVRLGPLPPRVVARADIAEVTIVERSASARLAAAVGAKPSEPAYAVREGPGVRLRLHGGRRLVVGSRRPEDLAAALGGPTG